MPLTDTPLKRSDCIISEELLQNDRKKHWYVMRDLKRPNAKLPAYKQLGNEHIEVFTPMKWSLKTKNGKQIREKIPFIQDLLFVHETQERLNPIVDKTPTLQYRYKKGGGYREPMTVADADMERFIYAVSVSDNPKYYLPEELTPGMCGRPVHIVGGSLDGYEGKLLTVRGSKTKRLLIELPGFFSVGVEVKPNYIQLL